MEQSPRMVASLLALACALTTPRLAFADNYDGAETFQTANFTVSAPSRATAMRIGRAAEQFRQEKAIEWFGAALPRWSERCAITVQWTFGRGRSYTAFKGRVPVRLVLDGPVSHLLANVLPHEITHAVVISHLDFHPPCWADEGAAVLSSSAEDGDRFDAKMHGLASNRFIPLRRLFELTDYPDDHEVLYAEGYSVTKFLVAARDRKTFLVFVEEGQANGWDRAVKKHYGYANVEALEKAWRKTLTWAGRRILTRATVALRHTDPRSNAVIESATLPRGIYTVVQEQGEWIKVQHGRASGWIGKEEALLLETAVPSLTQRILRNPNDGQVVGWRALAWREKGDTDKALRDLDLAIRLAPEQSAWYVYRGQLAWQRGEYRRAFADFADATVRLAGRETRLAGSTTPSPALKLAP